MRKSVLFAILVVVLMISVACGSSPSPAPTSVPAPTAAPTQASAPTAAPTQASAPTVVPTQAPPPTTVPSATSTPTPVPAGSSETFTKLTSTKWAWVTAANSSGKTTNVPNPAQYTVVFSGTAGTVAVKADCNNASGTFQSDGNNLSIVIGPMTMATCPPGSLSDQFVKQLGEVQSYLFEGADLILPLTMDSGLMRFKPAAAASAVPTKPPARTVVPPTVAAKPATTLDFNVELVGCRNTPTADKPGAIVLTFRFVPTGAAGPYRYFDMDENKEVPQIYDRPAEKGTGVIVAWGVQSADGQLKQKKLNYQASTFGCPGN